MKLSRLREIDRIVKVLALADDPERQRSGEAESAAALAANLLRDYQMTIIIPRGVRVKLVKVRDALNGLGTTGLPHVQEARNELRYASSAMVHPKAIALGQFCIFTGDYYLFVPTRDVTLE